MKIIKIALMIALFTSGLSVIDTVSSQNSESWFVASPIDPDDYNTTGEWESLKGSAQNDENTDILDTSWGYLYQTYILARSLLKILVSVFYIVPLVESLFNFSSTTVAMGPVVGRILNAALLIIYGISILYLLVYILKQQLEILVERRLWGNPELHTLLLRTQ